MLYIHEKIIKILSFHNYKIQNLNYLKFDEILQFICKNQISTQFISCNLM